MKLLDRLLARQARLMADLDPPRQKVNEHTDGTRGASNAHLEEAMASEAAALEAAQLHLDQSDLTAARAALATYVHTGRSVTAMTTLARICSEQGDFPAALAALQRAEILDPGDQRVWRLMAKLLAAQRQHRDALVYLRRLSCAGSDVSAVTHVELLRGMLRATEKKQSAGVARAAKRELQGAIQRFEVAPGINSALRQQAAGLYYLLSNGLPDAVRIYNVAEPCPPDHVDITSKVVSLDGWSRAHQLPVQSLAAPTPEDSPYSLYTLRDAQLHFGLGWSPVLGGGRAFAARDSIDGKHFRATTSHSPLFLFRESHAELRLPHDLPVEQSQALLAGGSESYYETVVRDLSGLALSEGLGLGRDMALVVPANMQSFQRELLELLGYGDNRLIEVSPHQPRLFRELLVPARLARESRFVAPLVGHWYRKRLVVKSAVPFRKLFVVPQGQLEIANAEAVLPLLKSLGFEQVNPKEHSVKALIELFSEARTIVGAPSEGMTNILFAQPGATVVVLRPLHWGDAGGGQVHLAALAAACSHGYIAIDCLRARAAEEGGVSVSVDLDQLSQRLEERH